MYGYYISGRCNEFGVDDIATVPIVDIALTEIDAQYIYPIAQAVAIQLNNVLWSTSTQQTDLVMIYPTRNSKLLAQGRT